MIEKRQHSRVLVQQLHAEISVSNHANLQTAVYQGTVVDMSYSGIKIKLLSAMLNVPPQSKITIVLTHANLSLPMTIKGMVRHISVNNEFGIAFSEGIQAKEVDELVFECVRKITSSTASV